MKNKRICVFCGEKPGPFRSSNIICGGTYQVCCIACEEEIKQLNELEQCKRALQLGLAETPDALEERIDVLSNAEAHRPSCLRCGTLLRFGSTQHLDNTPFGDNIFRDPLDVVPAFCSSCGKIEFFNPDFLNKNKYTAYLLELDTTV